MKKFIAIATSLVLFASCTRTINKDHKQTAPKTAEIKVNSMLPLVLGVYLGGSFVETKANTAAETKCKELMFSGVKTISGTVNFASNTHIFDIWCVQPEQKVSVSFTITKPAKTATKTSKK